MNDKTPLKDIPKTMRNVAQFSDKAQLANAALVCKSWNSIFSRELYSSLEWYGVGSPRNPTNEAIQAHAANIHFLIFKGSTLMDFPSRALTHLKSIQVSTPMWCPSTLNHLTTLLSPSRNSNLQSISLNISSQADYNPSGALLSGLRGCPALKSVQLSRLKFRPRDINSFFNLCAGLYNASVVDSQMFFDTTAQWPNSFPFLQTLHLDASFKTPFTVEILGRCSVLEHLLVDLQIKIHKTPEIGRAIEADCPRLHKLTITSSHLNLDDLAPIVQGCRRLTSLTIPKSGFGPNSFLALRQHFQHLTHIDADRTTGLKSQNIQEIMDSCSRLITLKACMMYARDIFASDRMWACKRLESLTLLICAIQNNYDNARIMLRLSRLKRLRVLGIGSERSYDQQGHHGLSFTLEDGLGHLSTLAQLRTLRFVGLKQQLKPGDIQWMLNSWPRLSAVSGVLHTNEYQRPVIDTMLRNRHIKRNN
ncbi:hypothetical protein BGX20_007178 [Mortierella sp. AD010]|nr:hypothetical protein BGX20_007178 [Mortierella sp. AD010]